MEWNSTEDPRPTSGVRTMVLLTILPFLNFPSGSQAHRRSCCLDVYGEVYINCTKVKLWKKRKMCFLVNKGLISQLWGVLSADISLLCQILVWHTFREPSHLRLHPTQNSPHLATKNHKGRDPNVLAWARTLLTVISYSRISKFTNALFRFQCILSISSNVFFFHHFLSHVSIFISILHLKLCRNIILQRTQDALLWTLESSKVSKPLL